VNGTTDTMITKTDSGCLSKIHDDLDWTGANANTHCWQSGDACDNLQFVNRSSFRVPHSSGENPFRGFDFCSDGIVVHRPRITSHESLASLMAEPTLQGKLLTRLTGNETTRLVYQQGPSEENPLPAATQWNTSQLTVWSQS